METNIQHPLLSTKTLHCASANSFLRHGLFLTTAHLSGCRASLNVDFAARNCEVASLILDQCMLSFPSGRALQRVKPPPGTAYCKGLTCDTMNIEVKEIQATLCSSRVMISVLYCTLMSFRAWAICLGVIRG